MTNHFVVVPGGNPAGGEVGFVGVADVTFEIEVHVGDQRFDAFDLDAEQERQAGFLVEVEDFAFEGQQRVPGDGQIDDGFQFDEPRFRSGLAFPAGEFSAGAGFESLGVGGQSGRDVDADALQSFAFGQA